MTAADWSRQMTRGICHATAGVALALACCLCGCVPNARIQTAWDAISLHTTPGIAAYKPLEVELL